MNFKNKWTYLAWVTFWVYAGNLITRPFIVPDKPLLSWNIPVCAVLVLVVWPIGWHFQNKAQKRIEELNQIQAEIDQIIEDLQASNRRRNEAEAMRLIDEFLKHPETGVRMERPKRRALLEGTAYDKYMRNDKDGK